MSRKRKKKTQPTRIITVTENINGQRRLKIDHIRNKSSVLSDSYKKPVKRKIRFNPTYSGFSVSIPVSRNQVTKVVKSAEKAIDKYKRFTRPSIIAQRTLKDIICKGRRDRRRALFRDRKIGRGKGLKGIRIYTPLSKFKC